MDTSPLCLVCVFLEGSRVFTINAPATNKVGELKDLMKEKLSIGYTADLLKLYKVSGALEEKRSSSLSMDDTVGFLYNGSHVVTEKIPEIVLPHATMLLASRQLLIYFPQAERSNSSSPNAIDTVVQAPKGGAAGLASDTAVFLAKLNDAIQDSVATRMDWMSENMGEIDNRIQEIRGYVKWVDETMNKMEKQMVRVDAQMTEMEPKVARLEAKVASIVSSMQMRHRSTMFDSSLAVGVT